MFSEYFKRVVGQIPLNNAAHCPLNTQAAEAMIQTISELQTPNDHLRAGWSKGYRHAHEIFAQLLDCESSSLTFLSNVATATSLVASSLDFKKGDRILTIDQEYASLAYPWHEISLRTGAQVDTFKSAPDLSICQSSLEAMMTESTRIVAISWVQFQTGSFVDVKSLTAKAHKVGALVVIDTTQAAGVCEVSMRDSGADIITGSMHKWIGGPTGLAYLAIQPHLISSLKPCAVGPYSFGQTAGIRNPDARRLATAGRFQSGTPSLVSIIGAAAAADIILQETVSKISAKALQLAQLLHQGLLTQGHHVISSTEKISPIVTFHPLQGIDGASSQLKEHGIGFALRGGGIRLSPHAFNTEDDINLTLQVLKPG